MERNIRNKATEKKLESGCGEFPEMVQVKKDKVLENFMKEFFPCAEFKKIGFFTKEMKGDYEAQAKRICTFFGFETVYEYGSKEFRGHISYSNSYLKEHPDQPFITVIPSIYD